MIAISEYLCKIKHVIESYLGFGQPGKVWFDQPNNNINCDHTNIWKTRKQ
jgi:hypothetical protein